LPPIEWFETVYTLPKAGDADFTQRSEFQIFYQDLWLPKAAGFQNFNQNIRDYRTAVMPMKVAGETKKLPHVSQESEGFALVIVKNCSKKWGYIIPEKLRDDEWEIPAYDKDNSSTHDFHKTLWSDGRTGQVKGGGWAPEAYDALSEYINKIKAFRKADKVKGWAVHKEMTNLLRANKGITDAEPSNKRKRKGRAVEERVYNDVVDVSDVEYSDDEEVEGVAV
jgi:hypothetical protein